jgi:hypothetical protein
MLVARPASCSAVKVAITSGGAFALGWLGLMPRIDRDGARRPGFPAVLLALELEPSCSDRHHACLCLPFLFVSGSKLLYLMGARFARGAAGL